MSLFSRLRKPDWEHKDAARRAQSAASGADPALLQKLPDLARNDTDAQVRLAALRRIDDLSLLGDRMRNDADAGVRATARTRYLQRLGDASVPTSERERVLAVEEDADILTQLAVQAPEPALRRLALERVNKPGLIAERCLKDPDPALRLWLLDRIDNVTALERIADAARKTDKTLARTARERAFAQKLASGDAAASRERALAICDELDALRRAVASTARERADALQAEWDGLRARFDPAMERRVAGYFSALTDAITGPKPRAAAIEHAPTAAASDNASDALLTLPEPADTAQERIPDLPTRESDPALIALLGELQARADRVGPRDLENIERRWLARLRDVQPLLDEERETEREFRALAERLQAKFDAAARAREDAAKSLEPKLDALQTALDAGKLSIARGLEAELETLRKTAGDALPRRVALRLGDAGRDIAKLAEWQHWSNNKVRARLCDEIEALAGSGLHPDAVAAKVKEAQTEWQRLDDSERAPGATETPPTGLSRRFRALCHRAIAPTRAYFEKRHEVRAAKREEFDALFEEIDTKLDDTLSPPALIGVKRRIVDHLRRVDELEPKHRGELSRRLRAGLTRIDELLAAHESRAEAAKRKLLSNLKRELQHVDLDIALERSRHAQAEWKQLGRAGKGVDDALYQELKSLTDPWFEQANTHQRAAAEGEAAQQAEARAILDELAELAKGDAEALRAAESRIAALNARWRALTPQRAEPDTRDGARRDGAMRGPSRGASESRGPSPRGADRRDGDTRGGQGRGADSRGRDDRGPRTRDAAPRRSGPDERAYDRALEQVQVAQQRAKQERAAAELVSIRDASRLCDQLEALTADSPQTQRTSLEERFAAIALPGDAAAALKQRFEAARDPELSLPLDGGSGGNATAQAEELVVRAELAAGVETPEEGRELRRRWQVKRLAERLGGAAADGAAQADELRGLLIAFAGLRGVEPARRHALATRMDVAVRAVE